MSGDKFLKLKHRGQSVTEDDVFFLESADAVANLPADAHPGSLAYTAGLAFVAQKDFDGTWKSVIEPEPDDTEPAAEDET